MENIDVIHFRMIFNFVLAQLAAILTCPFDVIKTHRQIELGEVTSKHRISSSTWSLLINLYKSKGLPGLYAGMFLGAHDHH